MINGNFISLRLFVFKKYVFGLLVLTIVGFLVWFANFSSPASPSVPDVEPVKRVSELMPTEELLLDEVDIQGALSSNEPTPVLTLQPYCKDASRVENMFKRDKRNYLVFLATSWFVQGEEAHLISDALKHAVSDTAAEKFDRDVRYLIRQNESNQQLSQQYDASSLTFKNYIELSRTLSYRSWRPINLKGQFIDAYQKQAEQYPEISVAILQKAFFQLAHSQQANDYIRSLLSLYRSFYELSPNYVKLLDSFQLNSVLSSLSTENALFVLNELLMLEQLTSTAQQQAIIERVTLANPVFAEVIKQAPIIESDKINSQELQAKLNQIIEGQSLTKSHMDLCALYNVDTIDTNIKVVYQDASSFPTFHPSCQNSLNKRAQEIDMFSLYNELTAEFMKVGINLDNLQDEQLIENADLSGLKEYLGNLDDFKRELAYLLMYSRPFHNKRFEIISAFIDKGIYEKNANAVALLQRLDKAQGLAVLDKLGNVDKPNQRSESLIYNLMLVRPMLTAEMVIQGFTQKYTAQSPDPLLKLLTNLRSNRQLKNWRILLNSLISNGAKIDKHHINEMFRLKLTKPNIFNQLKEWHPELYPKEPSELVIIKCDQ